MSFYFPECLINHSLLFPLPLPPMAVPTALPAQHRYLLSVRSGAYQIAQYSYWDWLSSLNWLLSTRLEHHRIDDSYFLKLLDGFLFGMETLTRTSPQPSFPPLLPFQSTPPHNFFFIWESILGGFDCLVSLPGLRWSSFALYWSIVASGPISFK